MSTTQTDFLRYLRTLTARQATGLLSDQQLLERFLHERSEASFATLVARHGPMVLSVCRRVLQHAQDAEDAFQATFLVLARKAGSIRKQASLGSWLHGVAFHSAECLKAKARRRAAHEGRMNAPPSGDALDDISWRELRAVLDEELRRLPEQHRAPLVLCYLEGRTQDEAARQLGWSKSTFRRRLESGRDALGRRLTRRGVTLSAALSAPLLTDAATQAALPPLLAASTARAGMAAAMGNAVGGMVSAQAAALAESGVASLLAKKGTIVIVFLSLMTLGIGGLLAHRAVPSRTFAEAPAAPNPLPARSASKDTAIEIKGRVLGPDGKPVAGAKVYVSTYSYMDKSDPKLRAKSDGAGRFRFLARPGEVPDRETMIAAVAPGHGPDWAPAPEHGELTLRLVEDDVPIKGRVLDLEGRPIAGATVRVKSLWKMPRDALTAGIKELQTKPKDRRDGFSQIYHKYKQVLSSVWGVLDTPKSTKTGADGRFQLRGFGRDRIAELHIEGPGIEYRVVTVIVRPGLAKRLPPDLYGPAFDYPAAPSKPIRGSVREKGTGKPLAGIRVGCQAGGGEHGSEAFTDKEGHYEIPGVRKSDQYYLNVGYRNPPYVNYSKEAGDTPGLGPLTVDFEMERALVLRIRATEKGSGRPVRGSVGYEVCRDNPSLSRFQTFPRNTRSADFNEKDGSYEQTVLPGPGYIVFRATKDAYARSRIKGMEDDHYLGGVLLSPVILGMYHTVVPINPSAADPQSLTCDIVLDRGRSLTGVVVDPEGRMLPGALAWGLNAVMGAIVPREDYALAGANFTATGLDPRYPRTLIFYHAEKKLAQALLVRGDEKKSPTVRLQPLGAFTGRVVDASGKPQSGLTVTLSFAHKQTRTLPEEHIFGNSSLNRALLNTRATTDKDGRFRLEGLVAGLKYDLNVGRGKNFTWGVRKDLAGKPGAAMDLGEIKMETPSEKKPKP